MRENDLQKLTYTFTRKQLESYVKRELTDDEWEKFCIETLDQIEFAIDDMADAV